MPLRPHGQALIDPTDPQRTASCDRCGHLFNLVALQWQQEWSGPSLYNKGYLVCPRCLDEPADFLRMNILGADPSPAFNSRIDPYLIDQTDWRITEDGEERITEDPSDEPRVTENDA